MFWIKASEFYSRAIRHPRLRGSIGFKSKSWTPASGSDDALRNNIGGSGEALRKNIGGSDDARRKGIGRSGDGPAGGVVNLAQRGTIGVPARQKATLGVRLVEAMVALVIFSAAAMGIYSWINTNLISLNRLAAVAESEFVVDSAVERLKLIDLRSETQGSFNVAGYQVEWRADLVEPWRQGKTQQGATGLYDFGLYDIHLELFKEARIQGSFQYRQTAWYMAREFKLEGDDDF